MGGKIDPAPAPMDPDAKKVKLTVSGTATASVEVASGTKLGDALQAAGVVIAEHQFRSGGRMVGKDTVVTDHMAVTATARSNGG